MKRALSIFSIIAVGVALLLGGYFISEAQKKHGEAEKEREEAEKERAQKNRRQEELEKKVLQNEFEIQSLLTDSARFILEAGKTGERGLINEEALLLLRKVEAKLTLDSSIKRRRVVLFLISHCLRKLDDGEGALRYAQELMSLADDSDTRAGAFTNLGDAYGKLKNHDKAISSYKAASILYKELADEARLASVYGSLGEAYFSQDTISARETAVEYWDKQLHFETDAEIIKLRKDYLVMHCILIGFGHKENGTPLATAIKYLEKAKTYRDVDHNNSDLQMMIDSIKPPP